MMVIVVSDNNYSNYCAYFIWIISFASHNNPLSKALFIILSAF